MYSFQAGRRESSWESFGSSVATEGAILRGKVSRKHGVRTVVFETQFLGKLKEFVGNACCRLTLRDANSMVDEKLLYVENGE